jgi:UDP-N-acetylglucosamine 4,6-dehydratase
MRVLLTGATGTFGTAFIRRMAGQHEIVAFSRDELKQAERAEALPPQLEARGIDPGWSRDVRWVLGDVRDPDSVRRAMAGCDTVVHAAALKRVDAVANDPWQAVLTNVMGTRNVVEIAVDLGVPRTVVVCSDKGVSPTNFYGATKMLAEQLATAADIQSHERYGEPDASRPRVCSVRYGNVAGSRGSVVGVWRRQARASQPLTLTDERMTRFWLTIERAVDFVWETLARMRGGEVFVPVLPTVRMIDVANAVMGDRKMALKTIGLRDGGEKLHEVLVGEHEAARTVVWADGVMAVLPWADPDGDLWGDGVAGPKAQPLTGAYASDTNTFKTLTVDEIRAALPSEEDR